MRSDVTISAYILSANGSLRRAARSALFTTLFAVAPTTQAVLLDFVLLPLLLENQSLVFFPSVAPSSGTVHGTKNSVNLCLKKKSDIYCIFSKFKYNEL